MNRTEFEPGVYHNIPFEDYLQIPALNASTAVYGLKSPKHLKGALDGVFQLESREVEIGKIVHALVEGQDLLGQLVTIPDYKKDPENVDGKGKRSFSKNTTWCKSKIAAFKEANSDKTIVEQSELDRIQGIYTSLKTDPKSASEFTSSFHEVTLISEIEGVPVKARLDGLKQDLSRFWDVKTSRDVETRWFGQSGCRLGYPFKFTFYERVLDSLGIRAEGASFIAVENHGVFDVNVMNFNLSDFEQWQDKVLGVIESYIRGLKADEWPGMYSDVEPFYTPEYLMEEEYV